MTTKKETTHQLIRRNLTLYQREHSQVWQCRYKVANKWLRGTIKEIKSVKFNIIFYENS